ncbi:hypothetical protein BC830DRAFT_1154205 [Chytriomyces sp. MP71]|nr:hypothetical protein BC830DRAFT_1154205 [Chytriomyces sp. MP71]
MLAHEHDDDDGVEWRVKAPDKMLAAKKGAGVSRLPTLAKRRDPFSTSSSSLHSSSSLQTSSFSSFSVSSSSSSASSSASSVVAPTPKKRKTVPSAASSLSSHSMHAKHAFTSASPKPLSNKCLLLSSKQLNNTSKNQPRLPSPALLPDLSINSNQPDREISPWKAAKSLCLSTHYCDEDVEFGCADDEPDSDLAVDMNATLKWPNEVAGCGFDRRRTALLRKLNFHRPNIHEEATQIAARLIQSVWRSYKDRKETQRRVQAVVTVQTLLRTRLARDVKLHSLHAEQEKKHHTAAIRIQSTFRKHIYQFRYAQLLHMTRFVQIRWKFMQTRRAILSFQSRYRTVLAIRETKKLIQNSFRVFEVAALQIQTAFRAYVTRTAWKRLRCTVLLCQERWRFLRKLRAVMAIQSRFRTIRAIQEERKLICRVESAALKIQSAFRRHFAHKRYSCLHSTVRRCQARWRFVRMEREQQSSLCRASDDDVAAKKIQAWWRMVILRRRFLKLKKIVEGVKGAYKMRRRQVLLEKLAQVQAQKRLLLREKQRLACVEEISSTKRETLPMAIPCTIVSPAAHESKNESPQFISVAVETTVAPTPSRTHRRTSRIPPSRNVSVSTIAKTTTTKQSTSLAMRRIFCHLDTLPVTALANLTNANTAANAGFQRVRLQTREVALGILRPPSPGLAPGMHRLAEEEVQRDPHCGVDSARVTRVKWKGVVQEEFPVVVTGCEPRGSCLRKGEQVFEEAERAPTVVPVARFVYLEECVGEGDVVEAVVESVGARGPGRRKVGDKGPGRFVFRGVKGKAGRVAK